MPVTPKLSYFICFTFRSGSYLLCEALANTGLAGKPDEYLVVRVDPWRPEFTLDQYRASFQLALDRGTVDGVFGTKVAWTWFGDTVEKLQHLSQREGKRVPDLIAEVFPSPHYIMLTRRDTVRQAISWVRAEWTNKWRSSDMLFQHHQGENLTIDPKDVDTRVGHILHCEASFERFFALHNIRPYRIVYEDLIERYEEIALEILDFLCIPHPAQVVFGPRRLQRQWDDAADELLRQYYTAKGIIPIPHATTGVLGNA